MFDMSEWCKQLGNAIMTNYCDFKNISGQDLEELYKWIDIKKDIAEAEYYEAAKIQALSIVEAMEKEDVPVAADPLVAGYNNRRYSSGRYAPAGRGHYGYMPYYGRMGYDDGYVEPDVPMGYTRYGYDEPVSHRNPNRTNGKYGMSYDKYNDLRKHYSATKDIESKKQMTEAASKVVDDMIDIMQDIWADLDDAEKAKHTQAIVEAAKKY